MRGENREIGGRNDDHELRLPFRIAWFSDDQDGGGRMRKIKITFALLILAITPALFNSCAQIDFSLRGFSDSSNLEGGGSGNGNPMIELSLSSFTPQSQAFSVRYCLSRIRA